MTNNSASNSAFGGLLNGGSFPAKMLDFRSPIAFNNEQDISLRKKIWPK